MTHLLVYGTLKKGQCRNASLGSSKFIKEVETEPKYSLYDNGHYPMLVEGGKTSIKGELYEVSEDQLTSVLDHVEGVAYGLYKRAEIAVKGVTETVIGYVYLRDVSRFSECGNQWPPVAK